MATPRYTRIDGKNSSSNWSSVVIIGCVCVCLVAGWMIVSSSVSPLQNARITFQQFVGARENGNIPPKETESSIPITLEDQFTRDNSSDSKIVVSNEEKNDRMSVKVYPDDNEVEKTVEENSDNLVQNDNEKVVQGENNKDFTYETTDGPKIIVPVGSPGQVKKDELNNLDERNRTKDLENPSNENTLQSLLKGNAETQNETSIQPNDWLTQSAESEKEKATLNVELPEKHSSYSWKLCNTSGGADYIPCLDNVKALKKLRSTKHYEHRERHCPDEPPTCLVPIPERYRSPVNWPKSRDKIWFSNVPHTQLAKYKGGQNWTKVSGQFIIFPGGGTQFTHGAPHYIDLVQEAIPEIAWGKRTRVIFDVGCGVASFGGYLFDNHVLTMSMAPKDEHEAQVQFALERGIPAISGVMGTKRLLFPSNVFDIVHCARCRVPWHIEGGKLLLELNRILRPGGYFVWSATPVYRNDDVDVGIWRAMYRLTKSICWELVTVSKDKLNRKATALFRKTMSNDCYQSRQQNDPPLCEESDDPDEAWNVTMKACLHKLPGDASARGFQWPELWPSRLEKPPYWLKDSDIGVYGKSARKDFTEDYEYWKQFVSDSYLNHAEIDWPSVRNVMDMRAVYGGFAAALKALQVWVMNVVPVDSTDTLPLIYERGLFGIYHDWCESFDTYPRTYDLLHANHLFSDLRKRCNNFIAVMTEVDRILRPGGKLMVIDDAETLGVVKDIAKSLNWMTLFTNARNNHRILCLKKSLWRPTEYQPLDSTFV